MSCCAWNVSKVDVDCYDSCWVYIRTQLDRNGLSIFAKTPFLFRPLSTYFPHPFSSLLFLMMKTLQDPFHGSRLKWLQPRVGAWWWLWNSVLSLLLLQGPCGVVFDRRVISSPVSHTAAAAPLITVQWFVCDTCICPFIRALLSRALFIDRC